jgi:ankyrin repeat protein
MKRQARSIQKLNMIKMKNLVDLDKGQLKKMNLDLVNDLGVRKSRSYYNSPKKQRKHYGKWRNKSLSHEWNAIPKVKPKLTKLQNQLFYAASSNDSLFLQQSKWMMTVKDFICKNEMGETLLYTAVSNNNLEFVKALLSMGVDINQRNYDGNTALHKAIQIKDFRMIKMLIQMNADRKAMNLWGLTPLHNNADRGILMHLNLHHFNSEDDRVTDESSDSSNWSQKLKQFSKELDREYARGMNKIKLFEFNKQ